MKANNKMCFMLLLAVFLTGSVSFGVAPVYLGTAGNFVILSKSGITCVPTSSVTGNMGVSPIAASAITGFGISLDSSGTFSTSDQVNGRVYAGNYFNPTPGMMAMAVNDMQTAYVDAAGRPNPDFVELGAGQIAGKKLTPGLYKWSTGVVLSGNIVLNGGPNDVWIFQIGGVLSTAVGTKMTLTGGAQAKNIFWQAVSCTMGASSHLEGIILSATTITMEDRASVN